MAYVEQYQEAYGAGEYAAASACAAVLSVAEEQQHLVAYAPLVKRIVIRRCRAPSTATTWSKLA